MTRPLWTLAEIVAASGGALDGGVHDTATFISGISIDTRSLEPGDLFVPLTDARDGHEFVTAAFATGAVAALVRASYERRPGDGTLIRVDDPLRALERIGIAARARLAPAVRVIAVTGSAGKTGTKEMLRACLKVCASSPEKVHAPEKSFNNHWGVPLTLARMPAETEFAVFEIGMNHAGEIRPLTKMVRPHVAIVTNVLPVHVGNFPDGIEGVAKAKAEIFEGLEAGGTAIILHDSPHCGLLRQAAEGHGAGVRTFGALGASDAWFEVTGRWTGETSEPITAIDARVRRSSGLSEVSYELGMPGDHIATNSLAVLLALSELGCQTAAALKPLRDLRPPAGRGARSVVGSLERQLLLLDEAYNANPASMRSALANLAYVPKEKHKRRVAVLGDMLELGDDSVAYHVGLKDVAERADLVLCCGPNMRHLYEALPEAKRGAWAPNYAELIPHVLATLAPGDVVMVKGSLGSRMAPIVDAIKKRFASGA